MQSVPCGARPDTRLFPASVSQPRSGQIRSVRTYNTRIYFYFELKTVLTFLGHVQLSRKKRSTGSPRRFRCASTSARPRGERAPVSPCLHPCPRTHGEIRGRNGPGWRSREPHTNPKRLKIHIRQHRQQVSVLQEWRRASDYGRATAVERTNDGGRASERAGDGGRATTAAKGRPSDSGGGRATAGEQRRASERASDRATAGDPCYTSREVNEARGGLILAAGRVRSKNKNNRKKNTKKTRPTENTPRNRH